MRSEPEKSIEALPTLLAARTDRRRLLTLLDQLMADKRIQETEPSRERQDMLKHIRGVLGRRAATACAAW